MSSLDLLPPLPLWLWVYTLGILALWNYKRSQSKASSHHLPLPPGPRPLPIIGNMLDVPTENMEQAFYDLTQKYGTKRTSIASQTSTHRWTGELVYLNTFGQHMIVLGSQEAALDLLDKRSAIYSSRMQSRLVDLCATNVGRRGIKH